MKHSRHTPVLVELVVLTAIAAVRAAPDAPPPADPPGWRQRFDALYHLQPGEDARFVPAPFPPERAAYYRNVASPQGNPVLADKGQFGFHWTDGKAPPLNHYSFSAGPGTVGSALQACGLYSWEMELGPGVEWAKLPPVDGDWIIRTDAPLEKKLSAVQAIIQRQTRRPIQLQRRVVEREVIVATGKFAFQPLPGANKDEGIYVMASERMTQSGGGSGMLTNLFDSLANITRHKLIDQTESSRQKAHWGYDLSAPHAAENAKELDALLLNVSRQTGLQLRVEKRPVEVWFLVDGQARVE